MAHGLTLTMRAVQPPPPRWVWSSCAPRDDFGKDADGKVVRGVPYRRPVEPPAVRDARPRWTTAHTRLLRMVKAASR